MLHARRLASIFAVAIAVLAASSGADAKSASSGAKGKGAGGAQSIGAPNAGKLRGAARLKGSRVLRQRKDAHSWALPELVHLLQSAAGHVAKKHKNAVLLLGDLSGRTGGPLEGHNSHQSGRDADVGFFVMNSKGKPVNVRHFVAFDNSGKGRELPWANFDEARNWTLVESLLTSDKADVHYIFITGGLRAKLLAYAARKKVSKELLTRAAAAMMSGRDADLHDDHMHVRIACPSSMRDVCVEDATGHSAVAKDDAGASP
jgi:penicillin-insensitive murein DD-endopeptidase